MRRVHRSSFAVCFGMSVLMWGASCSSDTQTSEADMETPDMAVDAPITEDMGADSDVTDTSADTDMGSECNPPSFSGLPTIPALKSLADAPARCGQDAHQWLSDPTLGDIVSEGGQKTYTARTLKALALAAEIDLPFEITYDVRVSVIEYVTQDRGELVTATAFVATPIPTQEQGKDFKMLMFLHGTSGFTDGCGPSLDDDTLLLSAVIASSGYVLVGPDYLGLKSRGEPTGFLHPYLGGQSVAMTSLDAARAVVKMDLMERHQTCVSDELLLLGGSQGGHAALWVDRLLPYYAPEFELLGTVATVPPADLFSQLTRALDAPVAATANTAAFMSAVAPWYGYGDRLSEVFVSPFDVEIPAAMAASCNPSDLLDVSLTSGLEDLFTASFLASVPQLDMDPVWGCMALENGLTTTSVARVDGSDRYAPTYGLMWVMGGADTLVNTPIERDAFAELCARGMENMIYVECDGASHTQATAQALPRILTFLEGRAKRAVFPAGRCEVTAPVDCTQ